jgi:hypothetical protein
MSWLRRTMQIAASEATAGRDCLILVNRMDDRTRVLSELMPLLDDGFSPISNHQIHNPETDATITLMSKHRQEVLSLAPARVAGINHRIVVASQCGTLPPPQMCHTLMVSIPSLIPCMHA